jgi:hypothetical protein
MSHKILAQEESPFGAGGNFHIDPEPSKICQELDRSEPSPTIKKKPETYRRKAQDIHILLSIPLISLSNLPGSIDST